MGAPVQAARRYIHVAGVPVRADAGLVVIAGLIGWSFWLRYSQVTARWSALLMAIVGTVLFIGSILAHELAHALVARHRGLHVSDITLHVFGGATRMTQEAARPGDELALTVAGPWTSITLGCAFGLVATGAGNIGLPEVAQVAGELGWLNVLLGFFNLLPGAPLDGGRILAAVVWRVTRDRARASRVAAVSGQFIGTGIVSLGLLEILLLSGGFIGGLWLVLIGWFLLRAAAVELRLAAVRERLRGHQVGDIVPDVAAVPSGTSLSMAAVAFRSGGSGVVAVVDGSGIVGALTATEFRKVPAEDYPLRTVDEVMTPVAELPAVPASAPATQLLPLVGDRPVVVLDGTRARSLATVLQLESVVEWLAPAPRRPEQWPEGSAEVGPGAALPAQKGQAASSSTASSSTPRHHAGAWWRPGVIALSGLVVLAAAGTVPMPLIEMSPGPALDVTALLRTDGPTHAVDGKLALTSVHLSAPSLVATARALFDSHREIVARTSVVPAGMRPGDFEASQLQIFRDSVRLASAVALRSAGYPVTVSGGGAVVRAVGTAGPAEGILAPGDIILAVKGARVQSASDLVARISGAVPGTPLELQVRRGDRQLALDVSPTWSADLEAPVLDVAVEDAAPLVKLPFDVRVSLDNVGGPSAGLMTALAVYAVTTGTDLTGGRTVAGTGTIEADGTVGPVGGVAEKVVAAARAGASIMLVPMSEAAEGRRAAAGLDVQVVPVASFSAALEHLRSLASH